MSKMDRSGPEGEVLFRIRASTPVRIFWRAIVLGNFWFVVAGFIGSVRVASASELPILWRVGAPILWIVLSAVLIWFLRQIWRGPAGESIIRIKPDFMQIEAPGLIGAPLHIPWSEVEAAAVDVGKPPQRLPGLPVLTVRALDNKADFRVVSALRLGTPGATVAILFWTPVDLPRPSLIARLYFGNKVKGILARVVDRTSAQSALAERTRLRQLTKEDEDELTPARGELRMRGWLSLGAMLVAVVAIMGLAFLWVATRAGLLYLSMTQFRGHS